MSNNLTLNFLIYIIVSCSTIGGNMNKEGFFKISYGMYIISSKIDSKLNGQIANTVFQVTSEPSQIAISINKLNLTHEFLLSSKLLAISILSQKATMQFIGKFGFKSGRDIDKFKDTNFKMGANGAPVVTDFANAYFEGEVVNNFDTGSHTIFIAKISNVDILNNDEPMTYDYYHKVIKGKSPKTAPTFISPQ